ncbi:unnamed protein product [Sympodiomycopsis kandeliae]
MHHWALTLVSLLCLSSVALAKQAVFAEEPTRPIGNGYCPGKGPPTPATRTCTTVQFPVHCTSPDFNQCVAGFKILYTNITTDESTWDCLSTGNTVNVVDRPACVDDNQQKGNSADDHQHTDKGKSTVEDSVHDKGKGEDSDKSDNDVGHTVMFSNQKDDHSELKRSASHINQSMHHPHHHSNFHLQTEKNLTPSDIDSLFSSLKGAQCQSIGLTLELSSVDQNCKVENFFIYWVNNTSWNVTITDQSPKGVLKVKVLDECVAAED